MIRPMINFDDDCDFKSVEIIDTVITFHYWGENGDETKSVSLDDLKNAIVILERAQK